MFNFTKDKKFPFYVEIFFYILLISLVIFSEKLIPGHDLVKAFILIASNFLLIGRLFWVLVWSGLMKLDLIHLSSILNVSLPFLVSLIFLFVEVSEKKKGGHLISISLLLIGFANIWSLKKIGLKNMMSFKDFLYHYEKTRQTDYERFRYLLSQKDKLLRPILKNVIIAGLLGLMSVSIYDGEYKNAGLEFGGVLILLIVDRFKKN